MAMRQSRRSLTVVTCAVALVALLSIVGYWRRPSLVLLPPSSVAPVSNEAPLRSELAPVVLTLVVISETTAVESVVAIKSALMYTSRPLHFHIVCSEDAIPILESKFQMIKRPAYSVEVTYYNVTRDYISERLQRAGIGGHPFQSVKVMLYELIDRDVEKAIFLDTDMIFTVDPLLLWIEFEKMTAQQLVAFPINEIGGEPGSICSCVLLLKLRQMRDPSALFMPSTLLPDTQRTSIGAQVFERAAAVTLPWDASNHDEHFSPLYPAFSDQGIFHVVWWFRPDLHMHLSVRWDLTSCRSRYGLRLGFHGEGDGPDMTEEEQLRRQYRHELGPEADTLIIPGILHFNCQPDDNVWEVEKYFEEEFGALVTVTARYKWIWLNRGEGAAKVTSRQRTHARWWDEELAHPAAFAPTASPARADRLIHIA